MSTYPEELIPEGMTPEEFQETEEFAMYDHLYDVIYEMERMLHPEWEERNG